MEHKNDQTRSKTIVFLAGVCALLLALSVVNATRAGRYRARLLQTENGALSQLCAQMDTIQTALQKGSYSTSADMLSSLSDTLNTASAGAKLTLSLLTADDVGAGEIYRFLSQVGDYTRALTRQLQSGKALTDRQKQSLRALLSYAGTLNDALRDVRLGLDDDTVRFDRLRLTLSRQEVPQTFDDAMTAAEQSLKAYPSLQYDGAFSDAQQQREAKALAGLEEISIQAAKSRAAKFLACEEKELVRESDEDSALGLYCFSRAGRTVGLTKRGGLLCYLTNPNYAGKSGIGAEEAVKVARTYLRDIGYDKMKETDYSTYDGVCTVNFAFADKGVTCYADRIRVSVGLDTATVVAVDARAYLMNHTARELPEKQVTLETAVRNLDDSLDLLGYKTAVILLGDGTEALCHELHCRDGAGQEVLVYADTQREREADVRLLLYADDGMLAK